jgi:hypothetical protein
MRLKVSDIGISGNVGGASAPGHAGQQHVDGVLGLLTGKDVVDWELVPGRSARNPAAGDFGQIADKPLFQPVAVAAGCQRQRAAKRDNNITASRDDGTDGSRGGDGWHDGREM